MRFLTKRTFGSKLLLVLFLIFLILTCYFFTIRLRNPPNVVLITIDCLRPDHLGCYGYARDTSPHIDALAEILIRLSQLATDFPEIDEMDLNPVFAFEQGKGARVVDARLKIIKEA